MTHSSAIATRSFVDLTQYGIRAPRPAVPKAPDYALYALLPAEGGMLKARLPDRRRHDPAVPVVRTASIVAKLVNQRPRGPVPVIFRKARPDWASELLGLVDDYRAGRVRFFANGLRCEDGHWCQFPAT